MLNIEGLVLWNIELSHRMLLQHGIRVLVPVKATPAPIQFPANVPRKNTGRWPTGEAQMELLASDPALTVATTL